MNRKILNAYATQSLGIDTLGLSTQEIEDKVLQVVSSDDFSKGLKSFVDFRKHELIDKIYLTDREKKRIRISLLYRYVRAIRNEAKDFNVTPEVFFKWLLERLKQKEKI